MLFVDYFFTLLPDGSIRMDDELSPEKIKVKDGEAFTVVIKDNKVTLRKNNNAGNVRKNIE